MPGGHVEGAHVDGLAVGDGDAGLGEQVRLVLVPERQDVVAVWDVGDVELPVRVAAADPDRRVVTAGVHRREKRLVDVLDDVLALTPEVEAPDLGRELADADHRAGDRAGGGGRGSQGGVHGGGASAGGQLAGRRVRGGIFARLELDEAELGEGEGLGALENSGS